MTDPLVQIVKLYQKSKLLSVRKSQGEILYLQIREALRLYVYRRMRDSEAQDALQDISIEIMRKLDSFYGDTDKEFWKFCYQIARFTLIDRYREMKADRLKPFSPEELEDLYNTPESKTGLSAGDRHDLEYAMTLLKNSEPDCLDLLWKFFVIGMAYDEIATEIDLKYDAVRMRVNRCLDTARGLL